MDDNGTEHQAPAPASPRGTNRRNSLETMLRWRWALTAVGAVLAVVLIANGAVLIGALIGVMVVMRTVIITKMTRRRQEMRERFQGRSGLQ
jgi:hypothetical protein